MGSKLMAEDRAKAAGALETRLVDALPALREFVRKLATRGGTSSDVDDIVQEVAARALRYRDSIDLERELAPWLRKAALRVFLDRRERLRRDAASERAPELVEESDSTLDDRDEVARLLAKLSEVEREVLSRFHQNGESVREIAKVLALAEGTVKSHLHRARKKLAGGEA